MMPQIVVFRAGQLNGFAFNDGQSNRTCADDFFGPAATRNEVVLSGPAYDVLVTESLKHDSDGVRKHQNEPSSSDCGTKEAHKWRRRFNIRTVPL
jgi:hypothetical protein